MSRKYCSKLSHIHLALMVCHSRVKESGLETVLQPLIADLKMLSTKGFTFSLDKVENTIQAALETISCDNFSAHMIGYFSLSHNTDRIRQYCMAAHAAIQHKFCEETFLIVA